ncbi:uncharacterized protein BDV14DRAFT_129951 [Aspergillus stella-maris]|uniref:uncharacterized protein n=1 Tax=Aspergillus stella-maris TaxID=1810926 RepID=UPI003CCE3727
MSPDHEEPLPPFLPNARFEIHHAAALAEQLRKDQTRCKEGLTPSGLALVLSNSGSPSPVVKAIAEHLTPSAEVSLVLKLARCESIIGTIKAYCDGLEHTTSEDNDTLLNGEAHMPKTEELEATLKVLHYLEERGKVSSITPRSSFKEIVAAVKLHLELSDDARTNFHNEGQGQNYRRTASSRKRCYMCRQQYGKNSGGAHDLYPALCVPCGSFNISSSRLSLPGNLVLDGKIALVTGGRINLGYHTALRLLRCGAHVIVSSRYPADAVSRYTRENDFGHWQSRLKVVGADFRAAKDAFRLVHIVKGLLYSWQDDDDEESGGLTGRRSLDILVNNAAQTLTDPVKAEAKAISREERLLKDTPQSKTLIADSTGDKYLPMVRGGLAASWIPTIENGDKEDKSSKELSIIPQKGLYTSGNTDLQCKSSWRQSLAEIPYEDLISAHSVNAFVPLILCRELLPYMGIDDPNPPSSKPITNPAGYIINVSSREGIFEDIPNSRSKAGHHVHTNMSKAAINMITETEAGSAWDKRRVAMNSVDPGYMSAAPDCAPKDGYCPIGFEDGAARVLWPVVVGEREGRVIRGRFLKHFEEGAAVVRRGY